MKFMFSRYELKSINTRLVRGRNQSASEGKFMGSMAPYGYRAYKLPGEKGNSLRRQKENSHQNQTTAQILHRPPYVGGTFCAMALPPVRWQYHIFAKKRFFLSTNALSYAIIPVRMY